MMQLCTNYNCFTPCLLGSRTINQKEPCRQLRVPSTQERKAEGSCLSETFCSTVPCGEYSHANNLQTSINGHIPC